MHGRGPAWIAAALLATLACTPGNPPAAPRHDTVFAPPSQAADDRSAVYATTTGEPRPAPPAPPPPPPRAEELLAPELGASTAAAKLVAELVVIRDSLVTTRYQHKTVVRKRSGHYAWDCSGMADWFLRRSAPRAARALKKARPRAIDFYDVIARTPTDKAARGWLQLSHVSEARAGDLFAFPRSRVSKSPVTGHVGFFVEQPWPVPGIEGAWAARIADATRTTHQDDTRADDGIGGFGFGTMMFVNDDTGTTIAYGWRGTNSGGYMPTHVAYGRVTR